MSFLMRGATLALAWFLVVNVVLSLAAAALARVTPRSPGWLLAMRLFPAVASAGFAALVFVPSYWQFEPRETAEGFDLTLMTFASLGLFLLAAGCVRGVVSWRLARRRARLWTETSTPLPPGFMGSTIPAFRIEADAPLMALVGLARPRLFVTRGLLDVLTHDELAAAVAHEVGHHRARDNVKRLAMRCAADVLSFLPASRRLEQQWTAAAEHAADAAAANAGAGLRLALASALVKVAQLMPPAGPSREPISALVGAAALAARIERLVEDVEDQPSDVFRPAAGAIAALAAMAVAYAPIVQTVHRVTELLVHSLP